MTPKNIAEPKTWDMVHVDLIGTYIKSIRQQQSGAIIKNNFIFTFMTMTNPVMGWFEISKLKTYNLN